MRAHGPLAPAGAAQRSRDDATQLDQDPTNVQLLAVGGARQCDYMLCDDSNQMVHWIALVLLYQPIGEHWGARRSFLAAMDVAALLAHFPESIVPAR